MSISIISGKEEQNIAMDHQLRQFKDFLQLYNKITEMCFGKCVDNFNDRNVAHNESDCVDKCVNKFARFNQKMMGVYIEVQTDINARRLVEVEAKTKEMQQLAEAKLAKEQLAEQSQQQPATTELAA